MLENRISRGQKTSQFDVAIIGGGFSGTTLAAQLLQRSGGTVSVVLIERGARLGRGVAYGTQCPGHLLNVRASNMSAYPDDPTHLLDWARLNHDPEVSPDDYLPRTTYGEYVASVLREQIQQNPCQVEHMHDEAIGLARLGNMTQIRLRSGRALLAGRVVLANGNFPPSDPRLPGKTPHSRRYVSNPWAAGAFGDVVRDKSILIVGSGLTGADVAISLRQRGFRGTIHILSRRGLMPQTHKATVPGSQLWANRFPRTVRALLRLIRIEIDAAEKAGSGWRGVIDSLRPFTQQIWRSLALSERRRFLRHVRPFWDVHRHRVAPAIGANLTSQIQNGELETHAGRITEYAEDGDGVEITYRDRKSGRRTRLRVDRVINCTGPESDCRKVSDPLLTSLFRQRLIRPDPLFLGLDVSADGALISADGLASDFLYAVGPIRKGTLWETIAVPELRVQTSEMAALLLESENTEEAETLRREPVAS